MIFVMMSRVRFINGLMLAAVLLFMAVSCSVKEHRDQCPTYLRIKSDTPLEPGTEAILTVFHEKDGMVYQMPVPCDSLYPNGYEVKVRRGVISANVLAGIKDMTVFGDMAKIQTAFQSDSLYRLSGSVESNDEECEIVSSPVKEFTILTLRINNTEEPFAFKLNGVWDRVYATDFRPGKGNLTFTLNESFLYAGSYECVLSRQGDDSLSLEVYQASDLRNPYKVLPLGKMMVQAGYDIDAVPMEDITVDVDLIVGTITIKVGDWDEVVFMVYKI